MGKKAEEKFLVDQIIAEENLVIDAQFLIQSILTEKGVSRSELAAKLGMTKARVSQMMKADANPTLRSLARVFHALGEEIVIERKARSTSSKSDASGDVSKAEWSEENVGSKGNPATRRHELLALSNGDWRSDAHTWADDPVELDNELAGNDNYSRVFWIAA